MASPFDVPGAKRTLVLALAMSFIGFAGVVGSVVELWPSLRGDPSIVSSAPPELLEAAEGVRESFEHSAIHHGLSVANLLVSALLLIGSFAVTGRVRSGIWWAKQALGANLAYTLAWAVGNTYFYYANRDQLMAYWRVWVATQELPAEGLDAVPPGAIALSSSCTVFVGALILAAIYFLLLRTARREDVRRFVTREG